MSQSLHKRNPGAPSQTPYTRVNEGLAEIYVFIIIITSLFCGLVCLGKEIEGNGAVIVTADPLCCYPDL